MGDDLDQIDIGLAREAQRLGLVNAGGEGNIPVATAEQQRQITLSGERAAGQPTIAAR